MHALRHVHQLLVSGGTMLDLHPVTEEHAEDARGGHLGVLADPEYANQDLPNAEASLEQAVVAGLYVPLRPRSSSTCSSITTTRMSS